MCSIQNRCPELILVWVLVHFARFCKRGLQVLGERLGFIVVSSENVLE